MSIRWHISVISVVLALEAAVPSAPPQAPPAADGPISAIMTTPAGRAAAMASATLWQAPPPLSPDELLQGPQGMFPYDFDHATADDGIACAFEKPGRLLGGKSPKFTCRTDGDRRLRLKYWDQEEQSGNREVFATVAATRLMWALGFMAVPGFPLAVRCEGCPENPVTGAGDRRTRRYVAMWQSVLPGPRIVSHTDLDQGWSWREMDEAIRELPAGPDHERQRMHFDALTLLGVLIQHGDRKPEQQALYCAAPVTVSAGEVRQAGDGDPHLLLVERPGETACPQAAAVLVDVGATFGGAGRTSNGTTAKMNLASWRRKPIFDRDRGACHGEITVSMAAGGGGQGHPVISEQGRRFLLEQLRRLTPDHLQALFRAARVDHIARPGRTAPSAVDDWVAAFLDKVGQIAARQCQPGS